MSAQPDKQPDAEPDAAALALRGTANSPTLAQSVIGAIDLTAWRDAKWRRLVAETEYDKTREPRGKIPGRMVGMHNFLTSMAAVDATYRNDPRFEKLASDPAHNNQIRPHSIQEAMVAIAAERAGQIAAPVMRSPDAGLDFVDAKGTPIDVKSPKSPSPFEHWTFDVSEPMASIRSQLALSATNTLTGQSEGVVVLLDTTFLSKEHYQQLAKAMREQLSPAERARVIETSIPANRMQKDFSVWRNNSWWKRLSGVEYDMVREPIGHVPGNAIGLHSEFDRLENVTQSYRDDPRFETLARDSGHSGQITPHSIREAMTALAVERTGIFQAPLMRPRSGAIDFVDAVGRPIEINTPMSASMSDNWRFDTERAFAGIERQLNQHAINPVTHLRQDVSLVIDTTYLNTMDYKSLNTLLETRLSEEQRQRVTVMSIPEKRLMLEPEIAPAPGNDRGAPRPSPGPAP